MPTFRVTAPDGRSFDVTGPEGATQDDALARVKSQYQSSQPGSALIGAPMADDRGDFSKGFDRGTQNMQGMLYGFAALVGDSAGHEGLTEWGLQGYRRNQQEAARSAARVGSFRDIKGAGDFFDYAQGVLGETAPFSATTVAGGGIGALIAKGAAKRLIAKGISEKLTKEALERALKDPVKKAAISAAMKRGALGGSFAASAATQQGGLYAELKDAGVEDATMPAWMYGAAMGALDVLPEAMLAKTLLNPKVVTKDLTDSFIRGALKTAAKTTAKQTLAEGLTEGAQEALAVVARAQSDENFKWDDKANERVLDSVVAGAVAGMFLGGAGGGIEALLTKREGTNDKAADARRSRTSATTSGGAAGAGAVLGAAAGDGGAAAAGGVRPGEVPAGAGEVDAAIPQGAAAPIPPPAAAAQSGAAPDGAPLEPGSSAPAPGQGEVPPLGGAAPGVDAGSAQAPEGVASAAPAPSDLAGGAVGDPAAGVPAAGVAPSPAYDKFGGTLPANDPRLVAAQEAARRALANPPAMDPRFAAEPAPPQSTPGVTDDTVSVEPIGHLTAQFRDARSPKAARRAVLVPDKSIQAHGIERLQAMAAGVKGEARLVPVENADGKGGVLYATLRNAQEFAKRKAAGENVDALIGEFTGADPLGQGGKPVTNQPAVVQRKDADGAVVQETVVDAQDVPAAVAAVGQEPGQVTVATPEEVVAQRESAVRGEEQPDPPLTDEIAALDREIEQAIADSRMAGQINGLKRLRGELQAEARERAAAAPSAIAESGLFSQLSPEHLTAWLHAHGARILDQSEDSDAVLATRAKFLNWISSDAPSKEQKKAYREWKKSAEMDLSMNPADETLLRQITAELPGAFKERALDWLGETRSRISEVRTRAKRGGWPLVRTVRHVLENAVDKEAADIYGDSKKAEATRKAPDVAPGAELQFVDEEQVGENRMTGLEIGTPAFFVGKGLNSADGVVHNQVVVGKGRVQATPWVGEDAEERALAAAASRQLQDTEATYVAEQLDKAGAKRLDLPAPGWYVLAYPRASAELRYSKAAGGMRTPAALTRQFIANARNRWNAIPRHLKEDSDPDAPVYGLHVTKYKDGEVVGTEMLASSELVRLGMALEPSLNDRGMNLKHRLEAALRVGMAALMDFDDRGARLRVSALEPGSRGLPYNLVLRDDPKGGRLITLGAAVGKQKLLNSGIYTSRSARARTVATIADPSPTRTPDVPMFDRSGSSAPQTIIYDENEAEFVPYTIGEEGEIVPTSLESNAPDTRQFETEERQNLRSTTEIDPVDAIGGSSRRSSSAMGVAPGNAAPTVLGQAPAVPPSVAPADPHVTRTTEPQNVLQPDGTIATVQREVEVPAWVMTAGQLGREPGKGISAPSPTPPINPTREMAPIPERDAPVFVEMRTPRLTETFRNVTDTLRGLLKVRGQLVVVDSFTNAVRVGAMRGIDRARIERAWDRMRAADAGGVVLHNGDQHLIIMNPARPDEAAFKTLAHEIGHVFWDESYAGAPAALREALADAYQKFAEAHPALIEESIKRGQLYNINEWMADQVAAWAYTDKVPRTAIEKFFHSVATSLTQIYEYMRGRGYKLDDTARMFIQFAVAGGTDTSVDPAFDSLGDANDTSFDMNVELRGQPAWQRKAWDKFRALKLKYPTLGKMADFTGEAMLGLHNAFLARVFKRVERMAPDPNHPFRRIMREFYKGVGENLSALGQSAATFYSDMDGRLQAFNTRFRGITDGMDERAKNELLVEALREQPIDPRSRHAAQLTAMRKLLSDIRQYMLDAGLPIRDVRDYFPQVYDKEALQSSTNARRASATAVEDITKQLQKDGVIDFVNGQPYTEARVQELLDGMLDDSFAVEFSPEAQLDPATDDAPFAQAMRPRKFPEEFRNAIRSILGSDGRPKYMSKSLDNVISTYVRQSVMRAEYNRRFGDTTWAQRLASWEALDAEGKSKFTQPQFDPQLKFKLLMDEATRKYGASTDDRAFMMDVMSAMLGQYNRIENPAVRKLTNGMMLYQNLRTLLFVTFASFPDIANVFIRTGEFKDTFRSMRSVAKAAMKGELNDMLRMYGHAADTFDSTIMRELMDLRDSDSKIWKLNEQWFRVTGLHRWTNFVRGMGLNVSQDYLVKHAERVLDGHPEAADSQRRLDELGVSAQDVRSWAEHKRSYFSEDGPKDEATQRVTSAIQRMVNDMVIHPTPPEKTLWGNSETMKLLWHLKSFMYGFTTRVLGRAWHELNRNGATTQQQLAVAGAVALMLPLAAFGLALRDLLQYWVWGKESYTPYDDPLAYMGVLAGRSGVTGVGQMAVDTWQASSRGRAPILATAGPTVTWLNDWMEYPLYKTVPSSIPVLSSIPGARDAVRDWLKPGE